MPLALLSWPEIQVMVLPNYASWMNLIEPWWKQLKNLALKGRRFETADDLEKVLRGSHTGTATDDRTGGGRSLTRSQRRHSVGLDPR
ncbi:MAG: transposase [Thermomicrobiales bacterium]